MLLVLDVRAVVYGELARLRGCKVYHIRTEPHVASLGSRGRKKRGAAGPCALHLGNKFYISLIIQAYARHLYWKCAK